MPICFVSALTGAGVAELLDFFNELAPSPREGNPPPFVKGEGEDAVKVTTTGNASDHVVAHVFKITNDPFVGKMSVFRIYQGTVRPDSQLLIGDARKPFKVGHLFKLQGGKHNEIAPAYPVTYVPLPRSTRFTTTRSCTIHTMPTATT